MFEGLLKIFLSEDQIRRLYSVINYYFGTHWETTAQKEERLQEEARLEQERIQKEQERIQKEQERLEQAFKNQTNNIIKATNNKLFKRSKCTDETRMYDMNLAENISNALKKITSFQYFDNHTNRTQTGRIIKCKKDRDSETNNQQKYENIWYHKTYDTNYYRGDKKTAIKNEVLAGGLMSFLLYDLSIKYRFNQNTKDVISKEIKGQGIQFLDISHYKRNKINRQTDINMEASLCATEISKCFDTIAKTSDVLYQSLLTTQAYNYILGNIDGHLGNMRIVNGTDVLPFDFDRSFDDSSEIYTGLVMNQTLPLLIGLKMVLGEDYFKKRIAEIIKTFENRKVHFDKLLETNCDILSIDTEQRNTIKQNIQRNLQNLEKLAGIPLEQKKETWVEYSTSQNPSSEPQIHK
jgi:hypothetical protein